MTNTGHTMRRASDFFGGLAAADADATTAVVIDVAGIADDAPIARLFVTDIARLGRGGTNAMFTWSRT